jgi:hypothetical protein
MVAKIPCIVFLGLLLFSMFTNFNSSYAQLTPTIQYQSYKNDQYGFSIEYPKTWNIVEHLDQKYVAKTIMISPDDNFQLHTGVIKNTNPYASLTSQQITGQITSTMKSGCSSATLQSRGFTCTSPQFNTNVTSYRGTPLYQVGMTWTKTFPNGSTMQWVSVWGMIPSGNDVWLVIVESSSDEFLKYMEEGQHMYNSLDISAIQQSVPIVLQNNVTIPSWIKNTAKWWSEGSVTDDDFIKSIQYLMQQGIIVIPTTQVSSSPSQGMPSWVKNDAKWWSEGTIGDGDFIKAIQYLVQNGIISVQIPVQAQAAITGQDGTASFQLADQNVQFKFVNDTTGQPLAGANVVLSVDSAQSLGALLVIDPSKHYPVQVIMLTPSETSSTLPASLKDYLIPDASAQIDKVVTVTLTTNVRQAGNLLPVSFLHKIGHVAENVNSVYDLLALNLKYADKNGWLPVSKYLQNHGYETGTISSDQAIDKITEENKQGKIIDGLFLMGSGGATLPGYLLSRVVGEITAKVDINTVSGCTSQQVQYVEVGSTIFYNCPTDKTSGLLKYDPPAETTDHVSLDLLSKANPGFGERIQTDQGQPVSVPADDYSVQVSAPGKSPITEDVTVTPEKITDVTAVPQPIANNGMTTTITPARDLSGTWSGTFTMKDTTSDGCFFSGTWEATLTQNGNDLSGSLSIIQASSPDYPANDYCTLAPGTFGFQGGTVSSSSFQFDSSDSGGFHTTGYFTTDLIRGNFNECSDGSCASGSFTGSRTG